MFCNVGIVLTVGAMLVFCNVGIVLTGGAMLCRCLFLLQSSYERFQLIVYPSSMSIFDEC